MNINNVNIGALVQARVEELHMSNAQFAKSIGLKRQNVVKTVFMKHGLDTDLLCRISEVLDCNFFDYYRTTEDDGNIKYDNTKEVRAFLTLEMGAEKQNRSLRFVFGERYRN